MVKAGKVHHWKHGWIPLDAFARRVLDRKTKDERDAERRARYNAHLNATAPQRQEMRDRYNAAQTRNAAKNAAMDERFIQSRRRALGAAGGGAARQSAPTGPVPAGARDVYGKSISKGSFVRLSGGDEGQVVGGQDGSAQLAPHRLAVKKANGSVVGVDARDVTLLEGKSRSFYPVGQLPEHDRLRRR